MKRLIAGALIFLLSVGSAYALPLADSQQQVATGKVSLVDRTHGTLTVQKPPMRYPASGDTENNSAGRISFLFDKETSIISSDGLRLKPEELSVGKEVKVQYQVIGGRFIARSIFVGVEMPRI